MAPNKSEKQKPVHICAQIGCKIVYDKRCTDFHQDAGGHSGRVVTLSTPTSEAGVPFPAWPQVGKLVADCRWSAVYSTEP